MATKSLVSDDQFWAHMLSRYKIRKNDLIYEEGKEKEYAVKDRDLLLNPNLWSMLIEKDDITSINYIIDSNPKVIDFQIVSIFAPITSIPDMMVLKVLDTFLNWNSNKKRRTYEFDVLAMSCISTNVKGYKAFKRIIDFMKKHKIAPHYGEYGNLCNGEGLGEAAKTGNPDLIRYMIYELKANPRLNEGWAFVHACKHAGYEAALILAKHGADVHAKNDLGKKMIERNIKAGVSPIGKAKECMDALIVLFDDVEDKK